MTRLPELEARLDALITEILLPLRASKVVDSEAINRLYELADDLAAEIGDLDTVPRLLAGKLWFVFTQMLGGPTPVASVAEMVAGHVTLDILHRPSVPERLHSSRRRTVMTRSRYAASRRGA
jgi:hypothetical protein